MENLNDEFKRKYLRSPFCDWKDCEETDVYRQATANKWFCLKHQHEYAYPKEGKQHTHEPDPDGGFEIADRADRINPSVAIVLGCKCGEALAAVTVGFEDWDAKDIELEKAGL